MVCINPLFIRRSGLHVRCGQCLPCREQRQKEWSVRLGLELDQAFTAYFVTLTFNDEFYEKYPKLDTLQFQRFLKRLRQYDLRGIPDTYEGKKVFKIASKGQNFKYFAVGEYGSKNNRPHWHMLLFNFPYDHEMTEIIIQYAWMEEIENVRKPLGFDYVGLLKSGSIEYVTDYLFKNDAKDSVRLISKGIGKNYATDTMVNYHQRTVDGIISVGNIKKPMPRYIKKQVYNEKQRKELGEKAVDFLLQQNIDDPYKVEQQFIKLKEKVKYRKLKTKL